MDEHGVQNGQMIELLYVLIVRLVHVYEDVEQHAEYLPHHRQKVCRERHVVLRGEDGLVRHILLDLHNDVLDVAWRREPDFLAPIVDPREVHRGTVGHVVGACAWCTVLVQRIVDEGYVCEEGERVRGEPFVDIHTHWSRHRLLYVIFSYFVD